MGLLGVLLLLLPLGADAAAADAGPDGGVDAAPDAGAPDARAAGTLVLTLRERGTGAPVAGALVQARPADGTGVPVEAATDEGGRAELALAPGRWAVAVYPAAHQEARQVVEVGDGPVAVHLAVGPRQDAEQVVEVVARAEIPAPVRRPLPVEQLEKIPGTGGDAFKVVQNLPGAARVPFGAGALVLRGTSPRDSRVFLDGVEIPQLFHFGGLVSVYNASFLGSIELYPGGFDARFGRTLGGAVEAVPRPVRTDGLHAALDLNFIDVTAQAEGPVGGGGGALSVRRSYVDAILQVALPERRELDLLVAPRYYDYQVRHDRRLGDGELAVYAYGSDDALELLRESPIGVNSPDQGRFLHRVMFHRAVGRHVVRAGPAVLTSLVAGGFDEVKLEAGDLASDQRRGSATLREQVDVEAAPWLALRAGVDAVASRWSFASVRPPALRPGEQVDPTSTLLYVAQVASHWGVLAGAFAGARLLAHDAVELAPSVRVDWTGRTGEVTVDPRLVVREAVGDRIVLRQSVGVYHQPPTDVDLDPVFGNPDLRSARAIQASLGAGVRVSESLRVDVDGFYTRLDALPVPAELVPGSRSASRRNRAGAGTAATLFTHLVGLQGYQTADGAGRSYGGELLVKRETRRMFGWIAYTLMRAERRDGPAEPWVPFTFDQTHVLAALASFDLGRGYRLGGRFRYTSGNPTTPIERSWLDADQGRYVPVAGAEGSERLPAFHALDLRFDKAWAFRSWTLQVYVDVQNVYSRQSVEGVTFAYDYSERAYLRGLPVLPSFGVKGSF